MNKIFKVVWSKTKECYVVVSEVAKNNGGKKKVLASVLAGLAMVGATAQMGTPVQAGSNTNGNNINVWSNQRVDTPTPGGPAVTNTNTQNTAGDNSVTIGQQLTTGTGAVAVGRLSTAAGDRAVAIGENVNAKKEDTISVGSSNNSNTGGGITIGKGNTADSTANGGRAAGNSQIAIGRDNKASQEDTLALGRANTASGSVSVAIGSRSEATNSGSIAIAGNGDGYKTTSTGQGSIAIGMQSNSTGKASTAVGGVSQATATGAAALGYSANATAESATALGQESVASVKDGVALGSHSKATTAAGVDGYNPADSRTNTYAGLSGNAKTSTLAAVSVGDGSNATRQITGLAAGKEDTDAVNVAQLKNVNLKYAGNSGSGDVLLNNGTLNLKGEGLISTKADGNGVTVKIATGNDITNNNGKAVAPSPNGVATTDNVVQAINKAGWNANASANGGALTGSATATKVVPGDTVTFSAGKNLTVAQTLGTNAQQYTYSLNKDVDLTSGGSLTVGGTTVTNGGVTITAPTGGTTTNVTLTNAGLNNGGNKITNVAEGKADTDAVNVKQLKDAKTILKDGKNTTVVGTGTAADPYKVNVEGALTGITSIANTATGPKMTFGGSSINITGGSLDMGNNKITSLATGTADTDAVNVKQLKDTELHITPGTYTPDANKKVKLTYTDGNSTVVTGKEAVIDLSSLATGGTTSTEKVQKAADATGDKNIAEVGPKSGDTFGAANATYEVSVSRNAVKDAAREAVTVNNGGNTDNPISVTPTPDNTNHNTTYAVTFDGNKAAKQIPLTYKANGTGDKTVKLDKGLDFTNGTNTTSEIGNDGVVKFNLNKDVDLSNTGSLTVGGTKVNNGGVTITAPAGGTTTDVKLTNTGLDNGGNKIINVKDGDVNATSKDAVNGSQLYTVDQKFNNKINLGADGNTETTKLALDNTGGIKFNIKGDGSGASGANQYISTTASGSDIKVDLTQDAKDKLNKTYNVTSTDNSVKVTTTSANGVTTFDLKVAPATGTTSTWDIKSSADTANGGTTATGHETNAKTIANTNSVEMIAGKNLSVKQTSDTNGAKVEFALSDEIAVGKDGANGIDGKIGVNGKDGASVVINGKDGSIGLTGAPGTPGAPGASATLKVKDGVPGVDGAPGTNLTRIVYTDKNNVEHQVATHDDGMKFAGDDGQANQATNANVIKKHLNSVVDIIGGATKADLTTNNIGVNNDGNKLLVQLSKNLNGINTIKNGGTTITLNDAPGGATNTPALTISGGNLSMGDGTHNNKIVNVAPGTDDNDAVNYKQLKAAKTEVKAGDNVTVKLTTDTTDGHNVYTVSAVTPAVYTKADGTKVYKIVDPTSGAITWNTKPDGTGTVVNAGDVITSFETPANGSTPGSTTGGTMIVNNVGSAINGKTGATYLDKLDAAAGDNNTKHAAVNVTDLKSTADALTDKGLKFDANVGGVKTNKLGSIVKVQGAGASADADYSGANIKTFINQTGDDTTIDVKLDKNLAGINSISNTTTGPKMEFGGNSINITGGSLNMGGSNITNLKSGIVNNNNTDDTNGANIGDVKKIAKDTDLHIAPTAGTTNNVAEYTVDANNKVTLTYQDGNGTAVAAPKAVIDLSALANKITSGYTFNANAIANGGTVANDATTPAAVTAVANGGTINYAAGKNLTVKQDIDATAKTHTYTYSLDKDINVETVTVTGQNGKDGKIGINGKNGTNGVNGTNRVDIQVEKGVDGIDGKNGTDGISRIVYEDKTGTHTVATMDDGLKFTGNNTVIENKQKLGSLVKVQGEGTKEGTTVINPTTGEKELVLSDGTTKFESAKDNIAVVADGADTLTVKLNKKLKGLDSVQTKTVELGDHTTPGGTTNITYNTGDNRIEYTTPGATPGTTDTKKVATTDDIWTIQGNGTDVKPVNGKVNVKAGDNVVITTPTTADGSMTINAVSPVVYTTPAGDKLTKKSDGKFYKADGSEYTGGDIIASFENPNANSIPAGKLNTTDGGMIVNNVGSAIKNLGSTGDNYLTKLDLANTATPNAAVNVSDLKSTADALKSNELHIRPTTSSRTGEIVNQGATGTAESYKYDATTKSVTLKYNDGTGAGVTGTEAKIDLSGLADQITSGYTFSTNAKGNLADGTTATATAVGNGKTVSFAAGKNLTVEQNINATTGEHTYTYALSDKITAGKDGVNGKDGSVGVTGKDGSSVVINGADGSIGMTGPKGQDGKDGINGRDGANLSMTSAKGEQVLVNRDPAHNADTDKAERIVYVPKDASGNPIQDANGKNIVREVATMDDGLKFTGNNTSTENKQKLGSLVKVQGEGTKESTAVDPATGKKYVVLSDGTTKFESAKDNIAVEANGTDTLTVKLNKNLKGLNSIQLGDNTIKSNGDNIEFTTKGGTTKTVATTDQLWTIQANGTDVPAKAGRVNLVAGDHITITPDAANGKMTISAAGFGSMDGFNVKTSADANGIHAGDTTENIKNGKTVDMQAGKNLVVTQTNDGNGNTIVNYALNKNVDLGNDGSLTTGNTIINNDGFKNGNTTVGGNGITINNPTDPTKTVSLTKDGLNNGGNQITNVASGGNVDTNAANIGDIKRLAKDTRIKDGTYTVDNNGTVELTYVDGIGNQVKDASGKAITAKITGLTTLDSTRVNVAVNGTGSGKAVGSTTPVKVTKGTEFVAGDNLIVELKAHTGNDLDNSVVYSLNKDLKGIETIKNGNTTITLHNNPTTAADPTAVTITGGNINMGGNRIVNVAPAKAGTDAVNLNQLKAARTNVISKDGTVTVTPTEDKTTGQMTYDLHVTPGQSPDLTRVTNKVDQLGEEIGRVGAQGAALSALKPIQYDPLEPTQIMAGYGNYRGTSAIAMGVAHYKNESTLIHGGISWAGGSSHMMANAGVTWKVGNRDSEAAVADRYRKGPISSAYAMQQEMAAMKAQNAGLKGEVSDLKAENEQMKAQIAAMMAKLGL